jgi:RHS repeat-associated protein
VNNVLVERYAYDVFGRPTIRDPNGGVLAASAWGNPYLFTGRAYDAESGLYYYRARYYDYATGRFLQPDPIGYQAGINLYKYCNNNAVNFVDPSGEWFETAWDAANVLMGIGSLAYNVGHGNLGLAALDAAGLAYDVVATAVPFLPGGASAAVKASRAGNTLARSINVGMDVANIAKQTDRAARVVDDLLSAAAYGRKVHDDVGYIMKNILRELENFAPIGKATRRTGIKPDFPGHGVWADITKATRRAWPEHLRHYSGFGEGIPILYWPGRGVVNMRHLYAGAGLGLVGAQLGANKK